MKELKVLRIEVIKKDIKDMTGWTIPKGTKIHIIKETTIENPRTNDKEYFKVVRVDNGTENLNLMPETCIKEIL